MVLLLWFSLVIILGVGLDARTTLPPRCKEYGYPENLRVALAGPNGITVSWKTGALSDGSDDPIAPHVKFSIHPDMSNATIVSGNSTSYGVRGKKQWYHNCRLEVLPSKIYYYHVLPTTCTNGSGNYSFMSAPAKGDSVPINITIVGDLGHTLNKPKTAPSVTTIEALAAVADVTSFYLHVGDISYADEHVSSGKSKYEEQWDDFQKRLEVFTAEKFYMTAPGNHEVTCSILNDSYCLKSDELNAFRNFTAYLNRFRMPGNESGGFQNLWYSFDYGLVHVVIINTETDFDNAPSGPGTGLNGGNFSTNVTQLQWLENDLIAARNNTEKVPWIIVAGHRPFFGSTPIYNYSREIRSDNCDQCQKAFAGLFEKYDVDFYFSGHVHWYERLLPANATGYPVAHDYNNPSGTIYVTSGAGGAPEHVQKQNTTANASAIVKSEYGYSRLEIKNSTYCELSFYDSHNKSRMDFVPIIRKHNLTRIHHPDHHHHHHHHENHQHHHHGAHQHHHHEDHQHHHGDHHHHAHHH